MKRLVMIKKNEDFETCIKRGRFAAEKKIVVYVLPNGLLLNRLGVSMSSKLGKATARNRFKRVVKAWYIKNCDRLKKGYDIVILARRIKQDKIKAKEIFLRDYEDELERAFKRLKMIDDNKNSA